MASFYQRLFTYRTRENRAPIEDFLTEALGDLLSRLPHKVMCEAVAFLLRNRQDAIRELQATWPPGKTAHWSTQQIIDGGYIIDLVMKIDGRPILVIENKISAGFQRHRDGKSPINDGAHNQLVTYGRWLESHSGEDWGGAVVLLTHWTPAPQRFEADSAAYPGRYRTTIRWSEFSRWLGGIVRTADRPEDAWVTLSIELIDFLRERGMDSERAGGRDWAALQVFISSADRLKNSISQIWKESDDILKPICRMRDIPVEFSTSYGCIWKYRYLDINKLGDIYIGVGVRFPGVSDYLETLAIDGEPYLFVEIASEYQYSLISRLNFPEIWLASDSLWLAKRAMRDLPVCADSFVEEAKSWVQDRLREAASSFNQVSFVEA